MLLNIEHLSKIEVVGERKYIEKTFDRDLVRVLACTMALLESGHSYVSVEFEVYGKVQGK